MQKIVDTLSDFFDWFLNDFMQSVSDAAHDIAAVLQYLLMLILTSPVWILPFIFWLLVERKRDNEYKKRTEEEDVVRKM